MRTGQAVAVAGRRLIGVEDDPALVPVLVVTLMAAAAFSTFWSYAGVWAVSSLGATPAQVGVMYVFSASTSAASAWAGGWLSDRLGRKSVILSSSTAQSAVILALALAGHHVLTGLAGAVLLAVAGSPARAAISALAADLVPAERGERAFSSVRLANNLGLIVGPPAAAGLLVAGGWSAFLTGIAVLGIAAAVVAVVLLPSLRPAARPRSAPRGILRLDLPLTLVLAATLLGGMVYTAFETVLPVVSVSSFHLPAATWGLLVGINPVLVTLFQVRLTRAIEARGPAAKMSAGVLLMGLPFLLLVASSGVGTIALVIVIFVFGEMAWVPTVQALVAGWPPADQLGARMGLFAGTIQLAWMTAPLVSLQLRAARGDEAMWAFFAVLAAASVTIGLAALRLGAREEAAR